MSQRLESRPKPAIKDPCPQVVGTLPTTQGLLEGQGIYYLGLGFRVQAMVCAVWVQGLSDRDYFHVDAYIVFWYMDPQGHINKHPGSEVREPRRVLI